MSLDINPWGLTSVLTALEALLFAFFLWKAAVPTPVTRRFSFLLLVEVVTLLSSGSGIPLLLNYQLSEQTQTMMDVLHHLGDVLMMVLYPIFVAHTLPLPLLKRLTGVPGRIALWSVGLLLLVWVALDHTKIFVTSFNPDMLLYLLMCIMFVLIFIVSLFGLKSANTKLAREKMRAFILAFGIRDIAWASVYLASASGWINSEGRDAAINQLYVCSTLLYIPIVAYGILKVQLLDIEVRLQSTVRNTVLASAFIAVFYLISESANNFISNQLGDIIGFVVCAVLAIFLAPLHRWADRFARKLISVDDKRPGYAADRGLQIYSAAVEEAMAYGEISRGQLALLDRLKESLGISLDDARKLELEHQFDRNAVAG